MSSREIADLTGKQHQHVKRDIEAMLAELGEDVSRFGRIYLDSMNREQTEFHLDRELTETLLTGYSAPLRRAVIARWRELEGRPPGAQELTTMQILQIAMHSEQERIRLSAALDAAQPAIQMVERYVEAKSSKCLSDVAKILGQKPQAFIARLSDDGVIFKRAGSWLPYQQHIDNGRFTVKTGESNGHAYHQTRVEPLGIEWLARNYGKGAVGHA
jgi:phage antirepressor YoqD-like protein